MFSADTTPAVIPAGEEREFEVIFHPAAETTYAGTIAVDIGYETHLVYLFGAGKLCPLAFSAEPLTITPNGDGFYDYTTFTFPIRGENKVEIFGMNLSLIRKLSSQELRMIWNGTDDGGKLCPAGAYIYIAWHNGEIISKGIIVVVR
ncbi:MAG: hypothetical protein DRN14_07045 [Thermoplasmata archaeon]|nr:MAG: hypothetical protein DRN14_07045 [Thermoplasmata archaeon]